MDKISIDDDGDVVMERYILAQFKGTTGKRPRRQRTLWLNLAADGCQEIEN
jgi:hypothetical protein